MINQKRYYFFLIILFGLFSCTEYKQVPVKPTVSFIAVDSYPDSVGYVGESSKRPFIIRAISEDGYSIEGQTINFRIRTGKAELIEKKTETDFNGLAYTYVKFLSTDSVTIEAYHQATDTSFFAPILVSSARASTINKLVLDTNLYYLKRMFQAKQLRLPLEDDFGNRPFGEKVVFKIQEGDGKFSNGSDSITVTTNEKGIAIADFMPGDRSSTHYLEATYGNGKKVVFKVKALNVIDSLKYETTRDHVALTWSKNDNEIFDKYVIVKTEKKPPYGEHNIWEYKIEITDESVTEYKDLEVLAGHRYDYKILAVLDSSYTLQSANEVSFDFGDFLVFKNNVHEIELMELEGRDKVIVSKNHSDDIDLIDVESSSFERELFFGSSPRGLAVDHLNKRLFVALSGIGEIATFEFKSSAVTTQRVSDILGYTRVWDILYDDTRNSIYFTGKRNFHDIASGIFKMDAEKKELTELNQVRRQERSEWVYSSGLIFAFNSSKQLQKIDVESGDIIGTLEGIESFSGFAPFEQAIFNEYSREIVRPYGYTINIDDMAETSRFVKGGSRIFSSNDQKSYYILGPGSTIKKMDSKTLIVEGEIALGCNSSQVKHVEMGLDDSYFVLIIEIKNYNTSYSEDRIYFLNNHLK